MTVGTKRVSGHFWATVHVCLRSRPALQVHDSCEGTPLVLGAPMHPLASRAQEQPRAWVHTPMHPLASRERAGDRSRVRSVCVNAPNCIAAAVHRRTPRPAPELPASRALTAGSREVPWAGIGMAVVTPDVVKRMSAARCASNHCHSRQVC